MKRKKQKRKIRRRRKRQKRGGGIPAVLLSTALPLLGKVIYKAVSSAVNKKNRRKR